VLVKLAKDFAVEFCGQRMVMGLVQSKSRDLGSDRGYRVAGWFQNGKLWGIPAMFFEECASGVESVGCGQVKIESPEVTENAGVRGARESSLRAKGYRRK
jgi:hypothetical protein